MSKLLFVMNNLQASKYINLTMLLQNASSKVICKLYNSFSNINQTKLLTKYNKVATNISPNCIFLPPGINSLGAFISPKRQETIGGKVNIRCFTVGQGNLSAKCVDGKNSENEDQNEGKLVTKVEDIDDEINRDQNSNKTEVTYKPLNMQAIQDITENVGKVISGYISQQQREATLRILKSHLVALNDIGGGINRDMYPSITEIKYLPLNNRSIEEITANVDSITAPYLTDKQRKKFVQVLKSNLVAISINERAEMRKKLCDQQRILIAKTAEEKKLVPEYKMAPIFCDESIVLFSERPDFRLSSIVLPDLTSSSSKPPENVEVQEIFSDRFLKVTETPDENPQKEKEKIIVQNNEANKQSE